MDTKASIRVFGKISLSGGAALSLLGFSAFSSGSETTFDGLVSFLVFKLGFEKTNIILLIIMMKSLASSKGNQLDFMLT